MANGKWQMADGGDTRWVMGDGRMRREAAAIHNHSRKLLSGKASVGARGRRGGWVNVSPSSHFESGIFIGEPAAEEVEGSVGQSRMGAYLGFMEFDKDCFVFDGFKTFPASFDNVGVQSRACHGNVIPDLKTGEFGE